MYNTRIIHIYVDSEVTKWILEFVKSFILAPTYNIPSLQASGDIRTCAVNQLFMLVYTVHIKHVKGIYKVFSRRVS